MGSHEQKRKSLGHDSLRRWGLGILGKLTLSNWLNRHAGYYHGPSWGNLSRLVPGTHLGLWASEQPRGLEYPGLPTGKQKWSTSQVVFCPPSSPKSLSPQSSFTHVSLSLKGSPPGFLSDWPPLFMPDSLSMSGYLADAILTPQPRPSLYFSLSQSLFFFSALSPHYHLYLSVC